MDDSCNPFLKVKSHPYRIYSVVIPTVILIFILESVYVFLSIPATLGTALTTLGPFSNPKVKSLLSGK